MAIKKTIEIDVQSQDLDTLNNQLEKTEQSFKDVDKAAEKTGGQVEEVTKNGGAIAILDQLTGGLATRFRDAFEATKLFNFSLKGTRTALIATGIGVFVVALGAVVAYWDEIVELIEGANKKLQKNIDLGRIRAKQLDDEITLLDKQAELNELEGKSNEEVLRLKKVKLELLQDENIALIENLQLQLDIEQSKAREVTTWEKLKILVAGQIDSDFKLEAIAGAVNENTERAIELQNQLTEAKKKSFDIDIAIAKANGAGAEGEEGEKTGTAVSAISGLPLETISSNIDSELEITALGAERLNSLLRQKSLERRNEAQAEADFKRDLLFAEAHLLGQFGGVLQQLGEKNKSLAVAGIVAEQIASAAKIVVATGEANAKAVAASPLSLGQPWVAINSISAGLSIASGAIAANKAIGQLGGGGGVQTPSIQGASGGGSTPQAPSFNIVGQSIGNQISDSLAANPIKSFVVASDVTTQQELDRKTVNTASIG